jgi:integrase
MKKFKGGEFHTWTEEEIALYEWHWPVGTKERLAFALLLFSGQRVGDGSEMTDNDFGTGKILVTPIKTKEKLEIPLHPALAKILVASPRTPGALLKTSFGKPFTRKGSPTSWLPQLAKPGSQLAA